MTVQTLRDETPRVNALALLKHDETPQSPMDQGYLCVFMTAGGHLKAVDHSGAVVDLMASGQTVDSQINSSVGSVAGASALSFGRDGVEGAHIKVIDEVVDLTALGATFKALTTPIPSGAVILSAQANVDELVVASGTTVKVALGLNAGDVDKYGKTSTLIKNQKINTIPDWAVLSGSEQIDVCGVVTDGSALGSGNITAGKVRVQIVYLALVSIANAA